jgi:uncharacterized phiE125 gp8 family phage protein
MRRNAMNAPPLPAAVLEAARDAAKAQLRSMTDAEDGLIERLAATALSVAEAFTGRIWIAREDWRDTLPAVPMWQMLGAAPVTAITSVEGVPAEGAAFALAADAYAIDIDAEGCGWVRVRSAGAAGRIRVTYRAGLVEDWDVLPPTIALGTALLTAHLFEGRGDDTPPAAVSALWGPWRRLRLREAAR